MKCFSIAIDGYAATGKGTLASLIAKKYDFKYLDTGAIYRAITYAYISGEYQGVDDILQNAKIEITKDEKVYLDGEDVTLDIRKQAVNDMVSILCKDVHVRDYATAFAQNVAKGVSIVMDGRDIGSVVLPNADVKFVITATLESRVKRRYEQNKQKGLKISEEQVKNDIINRDNNDKKNIVVSEDTIVIDNTNQSLEESLAEMCSHIDRKLGYVWLKV